MYTEGIVDGYQVLGVGTRPVCPEAVFRTEYIPVPLRTTHTQRQHMDIHTQVHHTPLSPTHRDTHRDTHTHTTTPHSPTSHTDIQIETHTHIATPHPSTSHTHRDTHRDPHIPKDPHTHTTTPHPNTPHTRISTPLFPSDWSPVSGSLLYRRLGDPSSSFPSDTTCPD